MTTKPISLRVAEEVKGDLEKIGRRFGTSPATLVADYVTRGVRATKHPSIEFRQTSAGRVAYVRGVRLPVWLAVQTAEDRGGDSEKAAKLLRIAELLLKASLIYAGAFPEEIASDLEAGHQALDYFDRLVPSHSFIRV
jgi:hypothetical protein